MTDSFETCNMDERTNEEVLRDHIDKLNHVIKVQAQALAEVRHAQDSGSQWYTRGADGLFMQVRMWLDKASEAHAKLTSTKPVPGKTNEQI
jgi:hypothetical protein